MFKLQEENKAANLKELLEKVQVLQTIEQVKHFEVRCNGEDLPQDNYEVALIFDFVDQNDLEAYRVHPLHRAFGDFVKKIRESRACIDYYFD
jgi:hypothetical protein